MADYEYKTFKIRYRMNEANNLQTPTQPPLVIADVRQSFSSIADFEKYISEECEKRFGFICEPFTIAKCFFYVNVPRSKVEEVKKMIFESMPIFKKCDIQQSRYFSNVRTLQFTF